METIDKRQVEDAENLAKVFSEKNTNDQEKSHVLVLVANAFQAGLDAGTGIAKLAEGR